LVEAGDFIALEVNDQLSRKLQKLEGDLGIAGIAVTLLQTDMEVVKDGPCPDDLSPQLCSLLHQRHLKKYQTTYPIIAKYCLQV
jgi:hypothetical protein